MRTHLRQGTAHLNYRRPVRIKMHSICQHVAVINTSHSNLRFAGGWTRFSAAALMTFSFETPPPIVEGHLSRCLLPPRGAVLAPRVCCREIRCPVASIWFTCGSPLPISTQIQVKHDDAARGVCYIVSRQRNGKSGVGGRYIDLSACLDPLAQICFDTSLESYEPKLSHDVFICCGGTDT